MFYGFEKSFCTSADAISDAMRVSNSLAWSDLGYFSACTSIEEFRRAEKEADEGDSWASYSITPNEGREGFRFFYSTRTGINSLDLEVTHDRCRATYTVFSVNSLKDSSAATAAREAGWDLVEDEETTLATQILLERAADRRRVENFNKFPELYMTFSVSFSPVRDDNGVTKFYSVDGHSLCTNPVNDMRLVDACPCLAPRIKYLAEIELKREFQTPAPYEFNENPAMTSSFYDDEFLEYRKGLRELIAYCKKPPIRQGVASIGEQYDELAMVNRQPIRRGCMK